MLFFFVLGSTQLISSSRLCSDVVFETSLVLFSLFLIIIIISPALIILLDLELIIMPSFIIYSCGVQWLWSFSLSYFNWINNCDHYVYSSYLVKNKLSVLNVLSVLSFIYLTHNTLNLTRLILNTMYIQHSQNLIKFNLYYHNLMLSNKYSVKSVLSVLSLVWAYWINQSILNKSTYNKLAVCLIKYAKLSLTCKIIIPLIKFSLTRLINFIMYWAKLIERVEYCIKRCVKFWAKFITCWALSIKRAKQIKQVELSNKSKWNKRVECDLWFNKRVECVECVDCDKLCKKYNHTVELSWFEHAKIIYNTFKIQWGLSVKRAKHINHSAQHLKVQHLIQHAKFSFYLFNTNELILLPLISTIRYYVFSYDVIHSLGIYSFGIKIDAIPGRFNFTTTIQTLIKGEHRGMCYEPCGLGHSSTLTIGLVLSLNHQTKRAEFI